MHHDASRVDRRTALTAILGGATGVVPVATGLADTIARTGMGLVSYCCGIRRRWLKSRHPSVDLFEPLTFLKHCQRLGTGGMQIRLGPLTPESQRTIRGFASKHEMFIEAAVAPPKDAADVDRFDAEMAAAAGVGARAARTVVMPGRRYERFKTLAEFREFEIRARRMVERAAPIVERHGVPLAIENHKDQRIDERIGLFEHIGSEFVGACVDTGNSFALLEDPVTTAEALAPWAKSVHLKDQSVRPYTDGFLLGDIPLGQGAFDLSRIVGILRKAQPGIRFSLELITRDALHVPCLTDDFWQTMPSVPARDLARTLRTVRVHAANALHEVSTLTLEDRLKLEDANVRASIAFARETLRL